MSNIDICPRKPINPRALENKNDRKTPAKDEASNLSHELETLDNDDSMETIINESTFDSTFCSNTSVDQSIKKETAAKVETTKNNFREGTIHWIILCIAFLVVLVAYCLAPWHYVNNVNKMERCSYEELQERYPAQNKDIWLTLKVGVENVLHASKPAIFLFVHDGGANRLVKEIAKQSSECVDKQSPIDVTTDFTSGDVVKDYGYAINKFKKRLHEGKTFLIADLNEILPESARALHAICDTYSPIATDFFMFMSLVTHQNNGSADMIAEGELRQLWGKTLEDYELDPLITRVTEETLLLK